MGIRFECPNGHKLHVKSFLAGKRGICPQCDARFRIPQESQIPKGAPRLRPEANSAVSESAPAVAADSTTAVAPAPAASHAGPLPEVAPREIEPLPSGETTETDPEVGQRSSGDPIDEAPEAVWYVRPPTGGQYGPARGDVMRRWIVEGRVSVDTLVWREGWPDWLSAGQLFPSLSEDEPESDSSPDLPVRLKLEPDKNGRSPNPRQRTPAGRPKSIAAIVTLALLTVFLLIALILVLMGIQ